MLQLIELEALLKQVFHDTSQRYANDVACGVCNIVIYGCVKALVAVHINVKIYTSPFLIPKVFSFSTPAACWSVKLHVRHLKLFLCFHIHISGGIFPFFAIKSLPCIFTHLDFNSQWLQCLTGFESWSFNSKVTCTVCNFAISSRGPWHFKDRCQCIWVFKSDYKCAICINVAGISICHIHRDNQFHVFIKNLKGRLEICLFWIFFFLLFISL